VRAGRWPKAVRGASLRTRVMAAAALLVALTSLVTAVLGTTLLRSYLLSRSDAQLLDFAKVASRIVERQQLQPGGSVRPQALPTQFLVEVISATGQVSMAGGPLGAADGLRLSTAQLGDTGTPFTTAATGTAGGSWRVLVQRLSGGGHLVIASSLGDLDSTVTRLEAADALAGAVAVALLVGLGLPLVRASLAPLARIEATAAAIAGGDLSRRIDHPPGNTEVGRLAEALDVMLNDIETAYLARADGEARALGSEERMRRFVADASHELRTPLTSVRGLAEYGLQQDGAASRQELLRLMGLIAREADRMGRLVADLLLLARFDAGRPLDRRPVDLASLAAEAVAQARIVDPGRPIMLEATEPVIVDADEARLRQIIDNLIGNAIQHTPPGSPVTVTVTAGPGRGELIVSDHGPGMTAEQASHVFERFYRADGARTRGRGGAGLGLAIAASLAAAHGGEITVNTAPGHGAAFHLRLPLVESLLAAHVLGGPGRLPDVPGDPFGEQADHHRQAYQDTQDRYADGPGHDGLARLRHDEEAEQQGSRDRLDHGRDKPAAHCDSDHGQQQAEHLGGRAEMAAQAGENQGQEQCELSGQRMPGQLASGREAPPGPAQDLVRGAEQEDRR
jgi:signal transduction histidine kinase